ncbi:MAG: hypothetical protein HQL32_05675 [Planctomycetes bacterium]|nr:hypothetical protein [Planctomycetota bacterium]
MRCPLQLLDKNPKVLFAFYFVLAASLQLLFFAAGSFSDAPDNCFYGDSWLLHSMASNYLDHGVMNYIEEGPTLTQLPGYPFLISLFYDLFGVDTRNILYFQIFCSSLIIPSAVLLLKKHLGGYSHLFALLLIFDLHTLLYSSCLMTEFWVWLFWFIAFLCWSQYDGQTKKYLIPLGFAFLCLAANFKPLPVHFALFFVLGMIVLGFKLFMSHWRLFFFGLAIFAVGLIPLLYRNYQVTEQFPRYSTISSFGAWHYNIAYRESDRLGISISESRFILVEKMRQKLISRGHEIAPIPLKIAGSRHEHIQALGLSEYEYANLADEMVAEYLKNNFFSYSWAHFKAAFNTFTISNLSWLKMVFLHYKAISFGHMSVGELLDMLKQGNVKSFLLFSRFYELTYVFVLMPFVMLALLAGWFSREKKFVILCAFFFISYVCLIAGLNTYGRFRYLFMPMFLFLGVLGVKYTLTYLRKTLFTRA